MKIPPLLSLSLFLLPRHQNIHELFAAGGFVAVYATPTAPLDLRRLAVACMGNVCMLAPIQKKEK